MKCMQVIPKAIVLSLMSVGWATSHAAMDARSDEDVSSPIGRMSVTLSASRVTEVVAKAKEARTSPVPGVVDARANEEERRFDLSVNNAPAAQVFMQLATGTDYNILVPSTLTGTVSLNLKHVTVLETLDTLRDMFGPCWSKSLR